MKRQERKSNKRSFQAKCQARHSRLSLCVEGRREGEKEALHGGLEIIQASAAVAKGENVKLFLGDISFSTSSEENLQMIYGKDM